MKRLKLKLYVWDNVLCDYTCGMVVAYAHNEEEALKMIREKSEMAWEEVERKKPMVVDKPDVFIVWGGG